MKPLLRGLPSASTTSEDWECWTLVAMRWRGTPEPRIAAETADRRDADLMLGVLQGRNLRIDHPGDPSGEFSGWLFGMPAVGAFSWPHFQRRWIDIV